MNKYECILKKYDIKTGKTDHIVLIIKVLAQDITGAWKIVEKDLEERRESNDIIEFQLI